MRRVTIVGNSGAGKSTLARQLAARLRVPHLELDSLYHQPDWQPLPEAELRARVEAFTAGEAWVVDGNYSTVRDLVWARADTVVWLDPPRRTVMRQVMWRTVRRVALRVELWNGNRERWINLVTRDPQRSIIAWAWQQDRVYRERYTGLRERPEWAHLRFVRLTSRSGVRRFLAAAASASTPSMD